MNLTAIIDFDGQFYEKEIFKLCELNSLLKKGNSFAVALRMVGEATTLSSFSTSPF
jgi:hypothetical protein